jgi:hypothetical protein
MLQNITQNKYFALDIIALNVDKPACDVISMLQVYVLYSVNYIRYFIWIIIWLAHLYKTKKIKMIVEGKKGRFYRSERHKSTDCGGSEACFVFACKFKPSL